MVFGFFLGGHSKGYLLGIRKKKASVLVSTPVHRDFVGQYRDF